MKKYRPLLLERLDRFTSSPRRRHAVATFLGSRPSPLDGLLARVYFAASASHWLSLTEDPEHLAPFIAGLDHCRRARTVLDLGCGGGATAAVLAERFPEASVYGVDFSARMVRVASQAHQAPNLVFMQADSRQLPFADSHFDLACMHNAVPDLDELTRVAAPGAEILATNTYFSLTDSLNGDAWTRRWDTAGYALLAAENVGSGHWQLLSRGA